MKKFASKLAGLTTAFSLILTGAACAHVVVKPATVGVGAFQTFTVGVPVEKSVPTVSLRLMIPEGVTSVTPNVKPGWTIETTKSGEGEDALVTEITWSGGSIPAGQRDDFVFSAKTPPKATTLAWKAFQTYEDGEIVAWDQAPVEEKHDDANEDLNKPEPKPYSQTKVVNDLETAATSETGTTEHGDAAAGTDDVTKAVSFAAVGIAVLSLIMVSRGRTTPIATKKEL